MPRTAPAFTGLSWDDVRLFLVLFRSRTMGQAASALGVDPSTVSRRLGALEEVLDTALFERGREGLRPTKSAEDLFPKAEMVELGVAEFSNAADGLEREVSGLVRVTCPPDVADVVVLPALRGLFERYPALRVTLLPAEATLDLNRREADLALRVVRPDRGDLVFKKVRAVDWLPAASVARAPGWSPLSDLDAVPWIGCGERTQGTSSGRWYARVLRSEPVIRTDSITTQIAAVAHGYGAALLPHPSIVHYGLRALPFADEARAADEARPRDDLFIVTHRALREVPRVRAVWDAIVSAAPPPVR